MIFSLSLSTVPNDVLVKCGEVGCNKQVTRIGQHLTRHHKLKAGTYEYLEAVCRSHRATFQVTDTSNTPETGENENDLDSKSARADNSDREEHCEATIPCSKPLITMRGPFRIWLTTIAGGLRNDKTAKQIVGQAFSLLSLIQPSCAKTYSPCEHCLNDPLAINCAVESLRVAGKKARAPGTLKSYVTCLNLYIGYVKQARPTVLPKEELDESQRLLRNWNRVITKLAKIHKIQSDAALAPELASKKDVKQYMKSGTRREALLTLLDKKATINQLTATRITHVLIADLLLGCAQRSGTVASVTVRQLKSARRLVDKSGRVTYLIDVPSDKTLSTYGAATVTLTHDLHEALLTYVTRLRPLPKDETSKEDGPVFLRQCGKPLRAADVSHAFGKAWGRAGCRQKHMTATKLRKSVATTCKQKRPGLSRKFTRFMRHSFATHNRYYALDMPQSDAEAAATAAGLRRLMGSDSYRREEPESDGECSENSAENESDSETESDTSICDDDTIIQELPDDCTLPDDCAPVTLDDRQLGETVSMSALLDDAALPPARRRFSLEETKVILQEFKEQIARRKVTLREVRQVAEQSEVVASIVRSTSLVTVYDRIRWQCSKTASFSGISERAAHLVDN